MIQKFLCVVNLCPHPVSKKSFKRSIRTIGCYIKFLKSPKGCHHYQYYILCMYQAINYFVAYIPECIVNANCSRQHACILEKCQDPCSTLTCGRNADCSVNQHHAICTCHPGYIGDPYSICQERKCMICCYILLNI